MWYSTLFFHLIFFTTFLPLRASYRCLLLEINLSLIRLFFHGIYNHICEQVSPRFFCCPTTFFPICWSRGTSESSTYGKQLICPCNSALAHFHVSWLSDFIFYPKPLYKSLHQSFFYSFITIFCSESSVRLHYCMNNYGTS